MVASSIVELFGKLLLIGAHFTHYIGLARHKIYWCFGDAILSIFTFDAIASRTQSKKRFINRIYVKIFIFVSIVAIVVIAMSNTIKFDCLPSS